jgi:probable rRNA maturation factor
LKIVIGNRQRRHPVGMKILRSLAQRILRDLGLTDSELSVTIVGDRTIRRINREYRGQDKATNVLSFSMAEGEFAGLNPQLLGDVVISADTAAREAEEEGVTFQERLAFLLLHGILHVTGFDHERSGEAEARRMEKKQGQLFSLLRREGLLPSSPENTP